MTGRGGQSAGWYVPYAMRESMTGERCSKTGKCYVGLVRRVPTTRG